ncbi:MAG: hypothetical protein SVT56_03835 [Chloroflexota bacterium]|jgi:hypothetical protein|nr:hypothetical protein [Chloroflexota bacterium]
MKEKNWKTNTIVIGVIIGALTGAASGFMLVKRAEAEDKKPKLSAGEGVQIGLSVLGMLRMISDFGSES